MKRFAAKMKVAWRILWADSSFVVTRRREVVKPYPDFDNDDPIVDTVYDLAFKAVVARVCKQAEDDAIESVPESMLDEVKEILGGGK